MITLDLRIIWLTAFYIVLFKLAANNFYLPEFHSSSYLLFPQLLRIFAARSGASETIYSSIPSEVPFLFLTISVKCFILSYLFGLFTSQNQDVFF